MSTESSHQVHTATVPVRWTDFDRFGHVTNSAYVDLAQEARTVWANDNFAVKGHQIPAVFVRHIEVDYLRPIMPSTSQVVVETEVVHIGNTSFTTRQHLKDGEGHVYATVIAVQVAVDMLTTRPRAIAAHELQVLTQFAASTQQESEQ